MMSATRILLCLVLWLALAGGAPAQTPTNYPINIGAAPNDGTGDTLRAAFGKANTNFSQLWNGKLDGTNGAAFGLKLRGSTNVFEHTNGAPPYGSILSTDGTNAFWRAETPGGGGGGVVSVANTIFVSKNGNDGTGLRERWDKPFLTPRAARGASLTNDLIVVFPGHYASGVTNLLKDLLNWYFYTGAVLSNFNSSPANYGGIFDNTAFGTPGVIRASVYGNGTFIQVGGGAVDEGIGGLINIQNEASTISIECDKLLISGDSSTFYASSLHAGKLQLTVHEEINGSYGPTETNGISQAGGIWWGSISPAGVDGRAWAVFKGNALFTGNASAFYSLSQTNGDFWADFQQVVSTNATAVWLQPTHEQSRFWLEAKEIKGGSNQLSTGTAIDVAGGKFYLLSNGKLSSFHSNGVPVIGQSGGISWMETQKIETSQGSPWLTQSGGFMDLRALEYFDLGMGTNNGHTNRPYSFLVSGGTNTLHGGRALSKWGPGLKVTGGKAEIRDLKIDTSGAMQSTNYPAWITGGTLTVENSTLIPGGDFSVFSGGAQNLRIYGALVTRSNVHQNITIVSGDLVVNDNIDR